MTNWADSLKSSDWRSSDMIGFECDDQLDVMHYSLQIDQCLMTLKFVKQWIDEPLHFDAPSVHDMTKWADIL